MNDKISHFLREEKLPCLYTDDVYVKAAQIFAMLRRECGATDDSLATPATRRHDNKAEASAKSSTKLLPQFDNAADKFLAYDLACVTLEYQRVLEDLIADVGLLSLHPDLLDVEPLALVMLGDYQRRKFQPRPRGATAAAATEAPPVVHEDTAAVASAVESCSMRLSAALARRRIRCNARSVEDMLPGGRPKTTELRQRVRQPTCAWVNLAKVSKADVIDALTEDCFLPVPSVGDLRGRTFLEDRSQDDFIAFSCDAKEDLRNHNLVKRRYIVLMDYTSFLGSRALKPALCSPTDVIHVDCGNGTATAHFSSIMRAAGIAGSILRFSTADDANNLVAAERLLQELGVTNVQLFSERFECVQPDDPRLKQARAALLTAGCTASAVTNPIDFLVTDGGDLSILQSHAGNKTSAASAKENAGKSQVLLRQALSVPSMKTVVYLTRSSNAIENEQVVSKALDLVNADLPPKRVYKQQPYGGPTGLASSSAPAPASAPTQAAVAPAGDAYFKLEPSTFNNGCFIAILSREAEETPPKRQTKDKLAKALAALNGATGGAPAPAAAMATAAGEAEGKPTAAMKKQKKTKVAFGRVTSATRRRKKK